MSRYPEHDKLTAISDESQAIGEFIETSDYTLCELKSFTEPLNDAGDTYETGPQFVPVAKSIQQVLADYFGIDLAKIETEKRAMLDALRSLNEARP